jgi:hypothetical protein
MSTPAFQPTLAFFGATGGCANAVLVHALRNGYKCVALVRTPSKLRQLLLDQKITEEILSSQLIITSGNAIDKETVKSTLTAGGPGTLPRTIITGLGAAPKVGWTPSKPFTFFTIDQPSICQDAAKTLVDAMTEILQEQAGLQSKKPALIFVSTTGITRGVEDVPFWMRWLYHWALHVPHLDKKAMEDMYRDKGDKVVFRAVSGVRPTLLSGAVDADSGIGLEKVRAGSEDKPALGYNIKRADVGQWIFKNLVHDEQAKSKWEGQMCSLTS